MCRLQINGRVFVAGQIPLVSGSMQLLTNGTSAQCRLALQHADRVLHAMCAGCSLRDVLLSICYVMHEDVIPVARRQWEKYLYKEEASIRVPQQFL
jgi:enamine deaminase RidA (YjgF/YER057c/UK114 family)